MCILGAELMFNKPLKSEVCVAGFAYACRLRFLGKLMLRWTPCSLLIRAYTSVPACNV